MNNDSIPTSLNVPLKSVIDLSVEHWRLTRWLPENCSENTSAPARHALRRIEDFLRDCKLETRMLDKSPFDAGLAVHVIDTIDDPNLPTGSAIVDETLSPMVLWQGKVVKVADVVTRRGV